MSACKEFVDGANEGYISIVCDNYWVVIFMEEYNDAMLPFARCCFSGANIVGRVGTSCCQNCQLEFLRYHWRYYLIGGTLPLDMFWSYV